MKLSIASPSPGKAFGIQIADANHRVVCTVHDGPAAGYIAEQIVDRFNRSWWQRLLPRWRDERQRAYDAWIMEKNTRNILAKTAVTRRNAGYGGNPRA